MFFRWKKKKDAQQIVVVIPQIGKPKLSPWLLSKKWKSMVSKERIMSMISWNWYSCQHQFSKEWPWRCPMRTHQVAVEAQISYTTFSGRIHLWNVVFISALVNISSPCMIRLGGCSHGAASRFDLGNSSEIPKWALLPRRIETAKLG